MNATGERTREPVGTIYGERWVRAAGRLDALPGEVRGPFARLLAHVEEGWRHARVLQSAVEAAPSYVDGYSPREVIFYTIEVLVVDLFRWLAHEAADAVPDLREGVAPPVNLDDVEAESELLMRYLILTELSLAHPDAPPELRARFAEPVARLKDWTLGFWRLFRPMERTLVALRLPLSTADRRRAR
ncbi:MAG TPA: hypothetical protein VFQ39_08565 [Longimicrobium sp.]|nr:hypothetical protein [Longimicrobium sp.]